MDFESPARSLTPRNMNRLFLGVLVLAVVLGVGSGYVMAANKKVTTTNGQSPTTAGAATAQQDNRTFRDFAEGTIQKKAEPKDPSAYSEGTHMLVRDGAMPVALTSSVVDLSEYENKKVKVFGETQKAIKEGWLMDVGKVEVQ